MPGDRHLTWQNFRTSFILPGHRAVHPIAGDPPVELFVESSGSRIGLRTPDDEAPDGAEPPLHGASLDLVVREGTRYLELSSGEREDFKLLYALLLEISDLIQLESVAPLEAIRRAVERFRELLRRPGQLTREQEIGLFGELWLATRLVGSNRPDAILAWVAVDPEAHDFHLASIDVEVKTTLALEREHRIHGLRQLAARPGHDLYLLSLQLAPAGVSSVASLDGLVAGLKSALARDSRALTHLEEGLAARGWGTGGYSDGWEPRRPARLVLVDENCPRILRPILDAELGAPLSTRVSDVTYRIDVEGLGISEESARFAQILGLEL